MINAKLQKIDWNGAWCANLDCQHDPKYHDHIIASHFNLKQDVTCLHISIDDNHEYYCPDCIDVLYQKLKPFLDRKLWIFT